MTPTSEQTDEATTPGSAEARTSGGPPTGPVTIDVARVDEPVEEPSTNAHDSAELDAGEGVLAALLDEFGGGEPPEAPGGRSVDRPRGRRFVSFWGRHRILSLIACVLGLLLTIAGWSYVKSVTAPGKTDPLSIRSVEWLRENHMGWFVNSVERWWYSGYGKPPEGGDPSHDIEIAGASSAASSTVPGQTTTAPANTPTHLAPPTTISTPAADPMPGEGEWQPIGPMIGGIPGMYATQIRPDATHTSVLGLAVWMDPNLVRFELHPGTEEPGGKWSTPPSIPPDQRADLVAAFNSGFKMNESRGGFYAEGRQAVPLKNGQATFVMKTDGSMAVGEWGRDLQMGPDIASARQNLALIVDGGAPVPGLTSDSGGKWGATLGGDVLVWRSGVGQTADGAIVYVASDALTAESLADMLVRAGAVRGMELDINHAWTQFNTFAPDASGTVKGTKGLPDMMKSGDRYLSTESRDFVAVFRRQL